MSSPAKRSSNSARDWVVIALGIIIGLGIIAASLTPYSPVKVTNVIAGADPGALVGVKMESQVGVLLDEIPQAERDRVASGGR